MSNIQTSLANSTKKIKTSLSNSTKKIKTSLSNSAKKIGTKLLLHRSSIIGTVLLTLLLSHSLKNFLLSAKEMAFLFDILKDGWDTIYGIYKDRQSANEKKKEQEAEIKKETEEAISEQNNQEDGNNQEEGNNQEDGNNLKKKRKKNKQNSEVGNTRCTSGTSF